MTLRWRIAAALAVTAALIGIAASAGAYLATARQLEAAVDSSLTSIATTLNSNHDGKGGSNRGGGGNSGTSADCPQSGELQPATAAQLVADDGAVTVCLPGSTRLPVDAKDLSATSARLRTVHIDGVPYRVLSIEWREGGVIQLGRDLRENDDVLGKLRLELSLLAAGGVVVAAAIGWAIARHIARPITALRDTAQAIAATQDLGTAVPTGATGEVGSLTASFTTMIAALAQSRDQQQRLITDASHEMRTPLTSLTSNVELLEQFERLPTADRTAVLDAVGVDVAELTQLLTQLVELSADPNTDTVPLEAAHLADIARDVAKRAERRSGRPILVTEEPPPAAIPLRLNEIERGIANLIDNAIKYGGSGRIEVMVSSHRLEVRDHGSGIAAEDQPHVFERFYRAIAARSRPGSGLGLAIVAQTVERHGGQVYARNHPDGGATVGFELPG